jgi:hypothetical protein
VIGDKRKQGLSYHLSPITYHFFSEEENVMDNNGSNGSKDMLYLVGGVALLIAGAGLIMAHPSVRQQLKSNLDRVLPGIPQNLSTGLSTVVPDFQRYMKIRNM